MNSDPRFSSMNLVLMTYAQLSQADIEKVLEWDRKITQARNAWLDATPEEKAEKAKAYKALLLERAMPSIIANSRSQDSYSVPDLRAQANLGE